jgi:uncharacterized protein with PIN domain
MVMNTSAIDVAIASRDTDAAVVVPRTLAEANKTLGSAPYVEDSEVLKRSKTELSHRSTQAGSRVD